jgi:hypothetical protein
VSVEGTDAECRRLGVRLSAGRGWFSRPAESCAAQEPDRPGRPVELVLAVMVARSNRDGSGGLGWPRQG